MYSCAEAFSLSKIADVASESLFTFILLGVPPVGDLKKLQQYISTNVVQK